MLFISLAFLIALFTFIIWYTIWIIKNIDPNHRLAIAFIYIVQGIVVGLYLIASWPFILHMYIKNLFEGAEYRRTKRRAGAYTKYFQRKMLKALGR